MRMRQYKQKRYTQYDLHYRDKNTQNMFCNPIAYIDG